MDIIAATSKNWAIGRDNQLLFSLKTDMKYFREKTVGKTVIVGRKTLDSFPGGAPLKGRTHLVLSRDPSFSRDGVVTFSRLEQLLQYVEKRGLDDAIVIGGEEIYRLFLPYCHRAYITRIDREVEDADRFLPNLDEEPGWVLTSRSEEHQENGLSFRFCVYTQGSEA